MQENSNTFIHFKQSISGIKLPDAFTFPFYYTAHELSKVATSELQTYLENQTDFLHNFGLEDYTEGLVIGKMFGILVVRNSKNEIGYLAAFSGKLANSNHHERFVPPVHDILDPNGYFIYEEQIVNQFTLDIEKIENDPKFLALLSEKKTLWAKAQHEISSYKEKMKRSRAKRKIKRTAASGQNIPALLIKHKEQSLFQQFLYKEMAVYYEDQKQQLEARISTFQKPLLELRKKRKEYSASLQKRLFNDYSFLNNNGESKSLYDIFYTERGITPPAGAGECAAPKLLQYAYLNNLEPISMAEFWWGASPNSQVRKHKEFYPSCRSKCEPILGHMLTGLRVDENPILKDGLQEVTLEILYEDEYLLAINKPHEYLSVPGKTNRKSVLMDLQSQYPNATGPILVHRLDMSTSGILLAAKTKDIHKALQEQFIKRTVNKRYEAILVGELKSKKGIIELPLRVDLDNRPHQMVCYEHGKNAKTAYKVKDIKDGRTRIHFFPITGRTHQLRIHAAHKLGLNLAIVGDDLYGRKADRLHLHAAQLEFIHPISKKKIIVKSPCPF